MSFQILPTSSCQESMYELIGEVTFYPIGCVSFPPFNAMRKHLTPSEVNIVSSQGVTSFELGARSAASLSESETSNGNSPENQVTVKFSIVNPEAATIDALEGVLAEPHHLLCRSMNEGMMWVSCLGEGYKTSLIENDGKLNVEIKITNHVGSQRVLS